MTTTFYILDSRAWRIEDVSLTGLTVADECLISEREKLVSFVINKSKYILKRPSLIVPWKQKNFSSFGNWKWHHPCFVAGGVFHFVDQLRQQQLNDIQFQPALKWPQVGDILWCFLASFFTASTMFCIFEIGWLIGDIFSFLTLIRWCCDVFVFRVLNVSRGEQLDQVGQNFLYHFLGLSSSLAWSFIFISSYFQFTKALGKVGIRR